MARPRSLLPLITTLSAGYSRSQVTVAALSVLKLDSLRAALRSCACRGLSYVIPPSRPPAQPPQLLRLPQLLQLLQRQPTSPCTTAPAARPRPRPRHPRTCSPLSLTTTTSRVRIVPLSPVTRRLMSSSSAPGTAGMDVTSSLSPSPKTKISFGPYDVSTQVFYETPLSFALVNLKPLLPGHVLVCPKKPHRRLTDLDAAELVDLFTSVQVVQRMLAAVYFGEHDAQDAQDAKEQLQKGSFNIAVQDGPEAGQTVPHVHVHVLPRIRGTTAKDLSTEGDALYEKMTDEPGNVGGAQWDAAADSERLDSSRPRPGGRFPKIEDASREARTMAAMEAEATDFRRALANLGINHGVARHRE